MNEVGPKVAAMVREFFPLERNVALVERLRGYGLMLTAERRCAARRWRADVCADGNAPDADAG